MQSAPPCLRCGACCFSRLERYARVTGADHARLGDAAEQLSVFIGNQCYMRMHEGHCGALLLDAAGSYVCSVYELRPEVCRALGRESSACDAERSGKSGRAQAATRALVRSLRV